MKVLTIKRVALIIYGLSFSFLLLGQSNQNLDSLRSLDLENYPDSVVLEVYNTLAGKLDDPQLKEKYANLLLSKAEGFDPIWKLTAYLQLGNAKKLTGDYELALSKYFIALEIAKNLTYTQEGIINITIADTYKVAENYDNAYIYYQNAKQVYLNSNLPIKNDSIYLAGVFTNLGDMFLIQKKYDSALHYFKKAENLAESVKYDYYLAVIRGNIGIVLAALDQNDSADIQISKSIDYLGQRGNWDTVAEFLIYMTDIYKENGKSDKAFEYASKTYNLAHKFGLKKRIQEASFRLYELMQNKGEYQTALAYHKEYVLYKDSVLNLESIQKMADLRTRFEVSQKQTEVDLLKEKQKGFFFAVFFLMILIVLIGTLAYVFIVWNKQKQEANYKLTQQTLELEKLNSTKDRFFSIISHDLRSPVSAFKGLSSLIQFSVDQKNYDELPEITQRITDASDKLSMLLDNLLEWAINQQGQLLYTPGKLDVRLLIEEILPIFGNMASAKKIELKLKINEEILIWAERNSLMTILRNLINNAIKFTENGGEVTISASKENEYAVVAVKDNGIGISKEKLGSLFLLKGKKSTWGTEGEKGLGLGLRLAHEFTEMNKGSIEVNSKEGEGTTFSVKIPIYRVKSL